MTFLRWLTSLFGARARREQDLKDELAFHFSTEVERRVAAGQSPADALASAKRDFGNVPLVEEVTRDMWGWSMLDLKLGGRMLLKYPGLTLAGGLALAIAIGVGAGYYDLIGKVMSPTIPLPEGDRLVVIETQNTLTSEPEPRVARDFLDWRRELRAIEDLGAHRADARHLVIRNARSEPIQIAQLTAAAFRTARVSPLLGRALLESDEMPGAPAVVLLGHDVWQRALDGRPDVVGSMVQLGGIPATEVGVMPEDFRYPVSHDAWTPLPLRASYAPLEGGPIGVIGRLARSVTLEQANAELRVLG